MRHLPINAFLLLLLLQSVQGFAQRIPSEDVLAQVEQLKENPIHKSEPQTALTSDISYTFLISNGQLTATEAWNETFISLTDGYGFRRYFATNNNSELMTASLLAGKKLKVRSNPKPDCISNFSDAIFDSDLKVCSYPVYFEVIGDKAKFNVKKKYYDVKYLTSTPLAESYPIVSRKITYTIPSWLEVDFVRMNFEGYEVAYEEKAVGSSKVHTFTIQHVAAHKNENGAPGNSYFEPHLIPIFKNYTTKGEKQTLLGSIDDQYNWYKSLVDSVENDATVFEGKLAEILKDQQTDDEKVKAIYYWVQDNIRYIAFERGIMGFKPESADQVFQKRYGDCKGMANLTKQMLKSAGFDARLAWIGTNSISGAYNYSFPSLANDNHMICVLMKGDEVEFLDATESYAAFGENAARIQGRRIMVENGDGYLIKDIPQTNYTENAIHSVTDLSIEGDQLKGTSKARYSGEEKRTVLQSYSQIRSQYKKDALIEFFSDGDRNVSITKNDQVDFEEREGQLEFSYSFTRNNEILEAGKKLYLNLDFNKEYSNLELDDERLMGYDFQSSNSVTAKTTLAIPNNCKVVSIPEGYTVDHERFAFSISYKQEGGKIVYEKALALKSSQLPKTEIASWNEAIQSLTKAYGAYVVLEKL